MTFCHDRSLGERPHFTTEGLRVDGPKERQPGEYPEWFLKYVNWAQQTKHGILILQLTEAYFKLGAQLSAQCQVDPDISRLVWFASWNWETLCVRLRSKPCRWEFGYVRQPELIHVFVSGKDGPQIVSWTDLMKDVELCNYAFGSGEGLAPTDLTELANNMGKDDQVTVMQTVSQVQAAAELVEAQERQSWCELPLREVAYALAKRNAGNPDLEAESATNLINAYNDTGQAARAKDLGLDLLEQLQQRLGTDHPEVATALNNLGNAYGALGDPGTQKDVQGRALKIKEQHFGTDHPEVATTLNNLGNAHGELGDYGRKKDLEERALKIKEQHFGADHPEVAATLNNLGMVHGNLGDHRTKKDLLERALKIEEQHFGTDHVEVAGTLNNLGNAHGALGDYHTHKDLLERTLKIREQHFVKLQQRSTTSAMPLEPWEMVAHRKTCWSEP